VVLADARDPQVLESMDQLGGRAKVIVLELPFHVVSHDLNWIHIRAIPRPVNNLERQLLRKSLILLEAW
jgi:hypothetical protein